MFDVILFYKYNEVFLPLFLALQQMNMLNLVWLCLWVQDKDSSSSNPVSFLLPYFLLNFN